MATLLLTLGTALGGTAAAGTAAAATGMTLAQGLQIGGTLLSAGGMISQGRAASKTADYNARQMEAQGLAEDASAQREAENIRRDKELTLSRARAVGASSGGGMDINLLGEIEAEGTLNEKTALWQGGERRKGRTGQAASARYEGLQAKRASLWKAGGTLLSGGSSFFSQYG